MLLDRLKLLEPREYVLTDALSPDRRGDGANCSPSVIARRIEDLDSNEAAHPTQNLHLRSQVVGELEPVELFTILRDEDYGLRRSFAFRSTVLRRSRARCSPYSGQE
jgi:hypothetical protein